MEIVFQVNGRARGFPLNGEDGGRSYLRRMEMTGKEPAVAFKIHDYFFLLWFWDRWVFNMWLFFELGLFILSILLSIRYILQQSSDEV